MTNKHKKEIRDFIIITIILMAFAMSGEVVLIFAVIVMSPLYLLYLIEPYSIISEYFKSIKK
jgi:hypothetical protein